MHEPTATSQDPLAPVIAALATMPAADAPGPAGAAARQLEAVAQAGRTQGWAVLPIGLQAGAEATELAQLHAAIALQSLRHGQPMAPTLLLSGGAVLHQGSAAGPAQFLLALALSMDEHRAVHAAAAGWEPASGQNVVAVLRPDTLQRARDRHGHPGQALLAGGGNDLLRDLGDVRPLGPGDGGAGILRAILITLV